MLALGLADGVTALVAFADPVKGAWGGYDGYETNVIDTAYALQGLKAASYPDLSVSNTALAYLTNTQNADGGWGFSKDEPTSIYLTAIVSATLQQFPQSDAISTAVNKATAYLLTHQNVDGGFGVTPAGAPSSTVFETALAYVALVGQGESGQQNAVTYLTSNQSVDGSWNQDPYATALAVKALYLSENKPAPPPPATTTGSVMATIVDAATNAPLSGVKAVLASDPSYTSSSNANGLFALSGIPAGSQQITLSYPNYAPLTISAPIGAGTFINLGTVSLSTTPTTGVVQGVVWDADENAPYPGVTVQVLSNLRYFETVSAADGSYKISYVPSGTLTVGTPTGPKPGYYNVPVTANLAAGGIMIYSPRMSKTAPLTVAISAKTEKTIYRQGETVGLAVTMSNTRPAGYEAALHVQVTGPSGTSVYDTTETVNITADGTTNRNLSFVLPPSAVSGFYTVKVDLVDGNEIKKGSTSTTFNLFLSQIAVTPVLPDRLAAGVNTVSFNLYNPGTYSVSAGSLAVSFKDPAGAVLASAALPFSLATAEGRNLSMSVTLPPLKLGTYTLSYTQSDETTLGEAKTTSLPNTLTATAAFDKSSYKAGDLANLLVTVVNTGKFFLDGVTVGVAVPDVGAAETKSVTVAQGQNAPLVYTVPIAKTATAGLHTVNILMSLAGGDTVTSSAVLDIPPPELKLSLNEAVFAAGSYVAPVLANSGGVDSDATCRVTLDDVNSARILDANIAGKVPAGSTSSYSVTIPGGAVDGTYIANVTCTDLQNARSATLQKAVSVSGVKGDLAAQTSKPAYLSTESIVATSGISNAGSDIVGGNLHLEVATAAGNKKQKTWTTKYDFQQGVRSSTDTFETPDAVTLIRYSDDFNDGVLNTDRWSLTPGPFGGPLPSEGNGVLLLQYQMSGWEWHGTYATTKSPLTGDFDASVDYKVLSPWSPYSDNHPAGFLVASQDWSWSARIDIWGYWPTYGAINYGSGHDAYDNYGGATTEGKFRIRRAGSNCYMYFWNGSGWTNMMTFTGQPTGPVYLQVMDFGPAGGNDVQYDNFVVASHTYPASGTVNLKYDSGRSEVWDKLTFTADTPTGTSIKFRTRTAETEAGLASAGWSGYLTTSGSPITSPKGRWIEVEAAFATTNTATTPVLRDVTVTQGRDAGYTVWQTDLPVNLAPQAVSNLTSTVGTIAAAGEYYLLGTLKSSTGQTVATSEHPFVVAQGNLAVSYGADRKVYKPGATVTISGEVRNLGAVDATNLSLSLKSTPPGGAPLNLYAAVVTVPAGGSRPFTVTTTAQAEGTVSLAATVSQNGTTLFDMTEKYEVASPKITAAMTAPDTAGKDPFSIGLALSNSGKTDGAVTVASSFSDAVETVSVPAGQTKLLQYPRQIDADTTFAFTVSGDLSQTLSKKVVYSGAASAPTVTAKIVTDRISYLPNVTATLTTTLSAGAMTENLTAWLTVTDPEGTAVYSDTAPIAAVVQGQVLTINKYWNTVTSAAGSYQAAVRIIDASGAVISQSSCSFVVETGSKPSALINGQLTLNKQTILTGEPVNVSYSVANIGNAPLADLSLSLSVVGVSDQRIYAGNVDHASIDMGSTYAKTTAVDTAGYGARDYLVVLQADIGGVQETVASSYFRVEGAPSAPALVSPATGTDVDTLTPTLAVGNAADPNDDRLTYQFEVYADRVMSRLVASGAVPETAASTAWTVGDPLVENAIYYWRARAYDGFLYGPWMAPASFRVNVANDQPSAPAPWSPAEATSVPVLTPTLTIGAASDPDSEMLTYNFQVALDPEFTRVVASAKGVTAGETGVSWTIPVELQENGWYYWRAQADDWLTEGPWSLTSHFQVNTTNDAPSAPTVSTPGNGSSVPALAADIVVRNAVDPDSRTLTYSFEIDTTPSFDSAQAIRSGMVAEGDGTTIWRAEGLADNTWYYLRARASDGISEGPWSAVTRFFANTANDPPTTPAAANPSDGAGVTTAVPTLSLHDASDPDQDTLTYGFELYADAAMTDLVAQQAGIAETPGMTAWTVPLSLAENQAYYWRGRAFDGSAYSGWSPVASFMVNAVNDAPGAPSISSPAPGSVVGTVTPTLAIVNAADPDSRALGYDFELYRGGALAASATRIAGDASGITSWTPDAPLNNETVYQWRSRAFDGESYGAWTSMAEFTVHLPVTTVTATIDFDPDTLNKSSKGSWVVAYIKLPAGYQATDVDVATVRLEGVAAESWPFAIGDHDRDGNVELMVKFKRSEVIEVLPEGAAVPVHVSGKVGGVSFEGIDVIRVTR